MNSGDVLKVWCWDKDDVDSGHVAIEIDGLIWGFYPTEPVGDINTPNESHGELKSEKERQVADYYVLLYLERPDLRLLSGQLEVDKSGLLISNKLTLPKAYVYSLNVGAEKYRALTKNLKGTKENPPNYHLTKSNCVNVTIKVLVDSGVFPNGSFDRIVKRPAPWLFRKEVVKFSETRPDLATSEQIKKIAWVRNGYRWINHQ